jgi:hypothetical protein
MIRAEPILRTVLLTVARANARARGVPLRHVSRAAYGDSGFFDRVAKRECSFTVAKFDAMMTHFADPKRWPKAGGERIVQECLKDAFCADGASRA